MPNKDINLYFVHGWACDGNIWHKWLAGINKNVSCTIFDRGYFTNNQKDICIKKGDALNVLVTHSLGLHFVPPESFQTIDLLVLTSSFRYFHEEDLNGRLTSKSTNLMKQRLVKDPLGLLQDFYLKCGLTNSKLPNISSLNSQLLYDDLLFLDNHKVDLSQLRQIPQILLLHGGCDQIVSPEHSKLMHELLPNSRLILNDQAGHALPITEARWCMQIIDNEKSIINQKLFILPTNASTQPYSSVTTNFGRAARTYDKAASAQKFAADRLTSRITKQSKSLSAGSILELGCGTGLLSQNLQNLFPQRTLYCVEPAEEMLSVCRNNLDNASTCQFIHGSIEDYFVDPKFSGARHALIASSFVLHWLFDFKLILNQLLEHLAPGGKLFFAFPVAGSFPQWQNICNRLNMPFTANQLPELADIKSAIDSNKVNLDYEEYSYDVEFQNSLQFFQHMKMLGANTKKFIPANSLRQTDFRSLLKTWDSQSSEVLGKSKGKVVCTYKILEGTITTR